MSKILRITLSGLLLWLFFTELIFWAMDRDGVGFSIAVYRLMHLAQMLCLLVFACWAGFRTRAAAAIPVSERALWGSVSTAIVVALLLSFCGDVINSYLFDLGSIVEPQTLLSIGPFMLAHFLYISAFWNLAHQTERGRSMGWRFVRNPSLLLWPLLAGLLWQAVVSPEAGPLMTGLSGVYALVVVLMTITALWVWFCRGWAFYQVALGGMLFLASDALLGSYLLDGAQRPFWSSQVIWITYFLGQFCFATVLLRSGMLLPDPVNSKATKVDQG